MTAAITPGPWGIAPETNGTELVAYSVDPWRVRVVLARGNFYDNPNWRNDLKAIAAVPAMVEALQAIRSRVAHGSSHGVGTDVHALAFNALKLAGIEL